MVEVVVTGLGVTTPLGNTPDKMFNNLLAGVSGIKTIQRFNTDDFKVKIAGEVREFDPSPYFEPKEVARTSRYIQYDGAGNGTISKKNAPSLLNDAKQCP